MRRTERRGQFFASGQVGNCRGGPAGPFSAGVKESWNDIEKALNNDTLEENDKATLEAFLRVEPPPSKNPAFHARFADAKQRIRHRLGQGSRCSRLDRPDAGGALGGPGRWHQPHGGPQGARCKKIAHHPRPTGGIEPAHRHHQGRGSPGKSRLLARDGVRKGSGRWWKIVRQVAPGIVSDRVATRERRRYHTLGKQGRSGEETPVPGTHFLGSPFRVIPPGLRLFRYPLPPST